MKRYLENKQNLETAIDRYSKTTAGKRLKYIASGAITICIVLIIATAFCVDFISWKILAIMRGCAGVSAIIFVISMAILLFRSNSLYWQERMDSKR